MAQALGSMVPNDAVAVCMSDLNGMDFSSQQCLLAP